MHFFKCRSEVLFVTKRRIRILSVCGRTAKTVPFYLSVSEIFEELMQESGTAVDDTKAAEDGSALHRSASVKRSLSRQFSDKRAVSPQMTRQISSPSKARSRTLSQSQADKDAKEKDETEVSVDFVCPGRVSKYRKSRSIERFLLSRTP
jgi:hypothetical protein